MLISATESGGCLVGNFESVLGKNGWPGGVSPGGPSEVPSGGSAEKAINSCLSMGASGEPFPVKRKGLTLVNTTGPGGVSNTTGIAGIFDFFKTSLNTHIGLVVANNPIGSALFKNNFDGSFGTLSPAVLTHLGSAYSPPSFAIASDIGFIVNGTSQVAVINSTTAYNFGITRPTVGSMSGTVGASGLHNGTYELRVSFLSSTTGHESSASDTVTVTITVANKAINWANVPVSSDPQVTARNLYVRNTSTQNQFFLAGSINNNLSSTTITSILDSNLTVAAPTTSSNEPPPSTIKYLAYYKGRLFAADNRNLYWSNIGDPESFNTISTDDINGSDGQSITGLYADHGQLLIMKSDSFYALQGENPDTWTITRQDGDAGCVAFRTIVSARGFTWWWSRYGLVRWAGSGPVDHIGQRTQGINYINENVTFIGLIPSYASGAYDSEHDRILMQLDGTKIYPWNASSGVMESEYWDPLPISVLTTTFDPNYQKLQTIVGTGYGQLFYIDIVSIPYYRDGIRSGTTYTGTLTPAGTTLSVISGSGFDTSGIGLGGRYVTILDPNGEVVYINNGLDPVHGTAQKLRTVIQNNTSTTVTLSGGLANLTPGSIYTYIIGAPNFEWSTPWIDDKNPWQKKRYEFALLGSKIPSESTHSQLIIDFDYDQDNSGGKRRTFSLTSTGSETLWNADLWEDVEAKTTRHRLARTGKSWRAKLVNRYPDEPVGGLFLGVKGTTQTEKS